MSFNSFSSTVKLNNIKTYSGVNTTNKSFKNQFYSDIKDIDYSQYEEIDYNVFDLEKGIEKAKEKANEQPWYKTAFDYTQTIRASFTWGVLEVVENIGDGLIMLGSASLATRASVVDTIFGTNYADKIKETASNMIAYDWTEAGYQAEMKALGVSEEIANGMAHTIAGGAGTMAGYVALSLIPGGAAVTATAGALSAAGSAADMAFKNGATYEEALTVSAVSAVAGGISGGALNKLGVAAKGAQSIGQVAGYAAAGAAVAMTEPVINSTAEYLTYGKDLVDETGNLVYNGYSDYYINSGGLLNTVMAGGIGAVSTGSQAFTGYKNNQKRYAASKATISEFNDSDMTALADNNEKNTFSKTNDMIFFGNKKNTKISDIDKVINSKIFHFIDNCTDYTPEEINRIKNEISKLDITQKQKILSSQVFNDSNVDSIFSIEFGEIKVSPKLIKNKKTFQFIFESDEGFFGYLPQEGTLYGTLQKELNTFSDSGSAKRNRLIRSFYFERSYELKSNVLDRFGIDVDSISDINSEELNKRIIDYTNGKENLSSLAKYCVEGRNDDKVVSRIFNTTLENNILEKRNIEKYGNPIGFSYEQRVDELTRRNKQNSVIFTDFDIQKDIVLGAFRKDEVTNSLVGLNTY